VFKFCNGRGTAEQGIKEGKQAVKWTKLSCRTFRDNQARLQLFALAYNLGNFLWRLAMPKAAALVSDDVAGEADQNRDEGDTALKVRDVSTRRGRRHAKLVCRHLRPHCATGAAAAVGHVTPQQIKEKNTRFTKEKDCADREIDAGNHSGWSLDLVFVRARAERESEIRQEFSVRST